MPLEPYRAAPPIQHLRSVVTSLDAALAAAPGMRPHSIFYPGTFFSTPHHYNVFLEGGTPVSSRLLRPALIDAQTGRLVNRQDMLFEIRALFLSRPLHFGDYGGLALKIDRARLDMAAIIILASGIYLWIKPRSRTVSQGEPN